MGVHAMIKRYLRRRRINDYYIKNGFDIPKEVTPMDLGCYLPYNKENNMNHNQETTKKLNINLKKGIGFFNAGRYIQKETQQYWMLEYIQQFHNSNKKPLKCIILGCIDYNKYQYSIYILELGYECKYTSEIGILKIGDIIWLNIDY